MIRNYIKIAWRNLFKNKVYSFVNIISLTIGIAACLLIGTMVINELNYDRNWDKAENIFRILRTDSITGRQYSSCLVGFGDAMKNTFPEVEASSRFDNSEMWFKFDKNQQPFQFNALTGEKDLWNILDFQIVDGNPKNFREGYTNLIISEKIKERFFHNTNPIGELVENVPVFGENEKFIITGVIKNIPTNTHLRSDVIVIKQYKETQLSTSGFGHFASQYILLKPGTDNDKFLIKVNNWFNSLTQYNSDIYKLQPVTDIYLKSDFAQVQEIKGKIRDVYIFSGIALILLLIGCINFVNLSTARALRRMKETGVRKVLGADKKSLIQLFLTEALLYFGLSFLLSILLFKTGLPILENFLGFDLQMTLTNNLVIFGFSLGGVILVSLFTGIYPAILLSKPKPISILNQKLTTSGDSGFLRKILVAVQFSMAIALLIATIIVNNQLNYIDQKDLGYDKDNLLNIDFTEWGTKANAFKEEVNKIAGVKNSSISSWYPTSGGGNMQRSRPNPENPAKDIEIWYIDADSSFVSTLDIQLLEGRYLNQSSDSPNYDPAQNDWNEIEKIQAQLPVLITQHTAKVLGIKELNKRNTVIDAIPVGIIADFNNQSLKNPLNPTIIRADNNSEMGNMLVRTNSKNRQGVINQIQKIYSSFYPGKIFKFSWVEDTLAKQYEKDRKLQSLFQLFSGLIIFLSCIGLFGLVTYVIESRIKEIGIRKVLGASVFRITKVLSMDFLKIIVVAGIFASPIIWILMDKWLQDYYYRITPSWWIFGGAILFAIIIAIATISFQTIKAARTNPGKILRTE